MCGVMLHINRVYIAKKQTDYFQKKKKKVFQENKMECSSSIFHGKCQQPF